MPPLVPSGCYNLDGFSQTASLTAKVRMPHWDATISWIYWQVTYRIALTAHKACGREKTVTSST